jgi:hypothetical protein
VVPDRHGFNLLGETVRCIDCPAGGPLWRWPERKRRSHARSHRPALRRNGRTVRRQRTLLAAPPTHPNEEKEASSMAKQTPTKGEPAKQVAIDVLRTAGEPLHAKEIAKRVLDSGRTRLGGKTPEQTITAMLAVGSKPGGPFTRVGKGTYTLADTATEPQMPAGALKPKWQPARRTGQAVKPAK